MGEDDLKWMVNENKILLLINSSIKKIVLQPLVFKSFLKKSHTSEMQHDALMHREGLNGSRDLQIQVGDHCSYLFNL